MSARWWWLWWMVAACVLPEVRNVSSEPATGFLFQSLDPAPIRYRLVPEKSWLYVVVYNDPAGMMSGYGHDHGIRAMQFDGKVVWDTAAPGSCSVEISFPATALTPDPPGMRDHERLDPDGAVNETKLATIRENFLSKSQLYAEQYPTLTYKATTCTPASDNKVRVDGNLTIRGVTKPVSTTMTVKADATTFSAAGTFKARATDFGFKPFTNMAGALRNQDEMKFVIDVVGVPAMP